MKTYIPKTTEWMRQNNWGAEAQQLVTADLTSCESCLAEAERDRDNWREIATSYRDQLNASKTEIERLKDRLESLESSIRER